MINSILFLIVSLSMVLTACLPVGSIEVGVEEPQVIVITKVADSPIENEPEPTIEPTDLPPAEVDPVGTVEGGICFPSENIPPLTAYFRNIDNGQLFEMPVAENQTSYSIDLPQGKYLLYAYPGNSELGGMYSEAVVCGLSVECVDHTPKLFDVFEGERTSSIDLCDWYASERVPVNPNKTIGLNPSLSGMVLGIGNGVFRVEENGTARLLPIPDQYDRLDISKDGLFAVFSYEDDIYLEDLTLGTWVNLTNTPDKWESSPKFIPGDAGRIFFFSGIIQEEMGRRVGEPGHMKLDGSEYTTIDIPVCCSVPGFDPTGTYMAFDAREEAYIYQFETQELTTFSPENYGLENVNRLVSPSWSPDGNKMAWWGLRDDIGQFLAIFDLVNMDHTIKHSYMPVGHEGSNTNPLWSPNGQWLASIALGDGAKATMWVLEVNGDEKFNMGSAGAHIWSPNSAAFIYRAWTGGPAWESELWMLVPDNFQTAKLELPQGVEPIAFLED